MGDVPGTSATEITERPHAPSGVAAFMSAHSKTPHITPSMDFYSGKGIVRGRRGQGAAARICLGLSGTGLVQQRHGDERLRPF